MPQPTEFLVRTANFHRPLRRVGCQERELGPRTEDLTFWTKSPRSFSRYPYTR